MAKNLRGLMFCVLMCLSAVAPLFSSDHVFLNGNHFRQNSNITGGDLLVREIYRQAFLKMCRTNLGAYTHDEILEGALSINAEQLAKKFDLRFYLEKDTKCRIELVLYQNGEWIKLTENEFHLEDVTNTETYIESAAQALFLAEDSWLPALAPYFEIMRLDAGGNEVFESKDISLPISFIQLFYELRSLHEEEIGLGIINQDYTALLYAHLYQETLHQVQGGGIVWLARALLYASEGMTDSHDKLNEYRVLSLIGFHDSILTLSSEDIPDHTYEAFIKFDHNQLDTEDSEIAKYLLALIANRSKDTGFSNKIRTQGMEMNPDSARLNDNLYNRLGKRKQHAYRRMNRVIDEMIIADSALQDALFRLTVFIAPMEPSGDNNLQGIDDQTTSAASHVSIVNSSEESALQKYQQSKLATAGERLTWSDATAGVPSYAVLSEQIGQQRANLLSYIAGPRDKIDANTPEHELYLSELMQLKDLIEFPILAKRLPKTDQEQLALSWNPTEARFFDIVSNLRYYDGTIENFVITDRVATEVIESKKIRGIRNKSRPFTYFEAPTTPSALFAINTYDQWALKSLLEESRDWKIYWNQLNPEQRERIDYLALVAQNRFSELDYVGAKADLDSIKEQTGSEIPLNMSNLNLDLILLNETPQNYLEALDYHIENNASGLDISFSKLKKAEAYWALGDYEKAMKFAKEGASSYARFALTYSSMIHWLCGDHEEALALQASNYKQYKIIEDLAVFESMTGILNKSFLNELNLEQSQIKDESILRTSVISRDWGAVVDYYAKKQGQLMPSDYFLKAIALAAEGSPKALSAESILEGIRLDSMRERVDTHYQAELPLLNALRVIVDDDLDEHESVQLLSEVVGSIHLLERCKLAALSGLYCEVRGMETEAYEFYKQAARPRAYTLRFVPIAFARLTERSLTPLPPKL